MKHYVESINCCRVLALYLILRVCVSKMRLLKSVITENNMQSPVTLCHYVQSKHKRMGTWEIVFAITSIRGSYTSDCYRF